MELRTVNTFLHIAELHSFSRTARQLGYSQSAVSSQIAQLEAELGTPLFDRVGKTVRLTDAGQTFLRYARTLLETAQPPCSPPSRCGAACALRWRIPYAAPFCRDYCSATTPAARRWNWCCIPLPRTRCCNC